MKQTEIDKLWTILLDLEERKLTVGQAVDKIVPITHKRDLRSRALRREEREELKLASPKDIEGSELDELLTRVFYGQETWRTVELGENVPVTVYQAKQAIEKLIHKKVVEELEMLGAGFWNNYIQDGETLKYCSVCGKPTTYGECNCRVIIQERLEQLNKQGE